MSSFFSSKGFSNDEVSKMAYKMYVPISSSILHPLCSCCSVVVTHPLEMIVAVKDNFHVANSGTR